MKALFPVLVGALVALVVGDVLILGVGQSPADVYRLLLEGTWGNPYGFAQVLYKATTLTFTGLAVALALRAGLFNIGAEAQLALGGFAASVAGLALPIHTPAFLAIVVCVVAAAAGGAVGGAVPGALNAWFGANEVITTILLNFVVLFFLNWVVTAHLHVPETVHTPALTNGIVPRLSVLIPAFRGSAANATVLLAIAAAVVTGWFVFRTRFGYELRAVGLSPDAAEAAGIVLPRVRVATFALAGA
ncbi:MAG TPA: ABC transporter permease, partial [Gemmatimonadaceae bacterium]|nr:ABC transporter permease [Gemmatimonadaceae bacterium]